MRAVAIGVVILIAGCASTGQEPVSNACHRSVAEHVENVLQLQDYRIVRLQFPEASGSSRSNHGNGRAWIKTPSCDGYVVAYIRADERRCRQVHYSVPDYVGSVYGTSEQCRALLHGQG